MNAELFNTALLEKMYVCRELIFLNSTSLPHIGTLRCNNPYATIPDIVLLW